MSEITIFDKSQEIRFETELYANTCERVANVLDDINDTKANKVEVSASIQAILDELALLEESIYTYVDTQDNDLRALINTKLTKPAISTFADAFYLVRARVGLEPDYLPLTLAPNTVPYWVGNTFFNSPITVNSIYVGINKASPTEALDVAGSVRANSFKYNIQTANSVPLKTWTDGSDLWFTDQSGVDNKLGTGLNISNANLTNSTARIFTQAAAFTWNTAGQPHYLKGLLDKTNQAAYSKVVIVHPTTGETVTRDFADPSATTLAVQNASTAQKTAMRTALLGNAVPASPIINVVNTYYIKRNTFTMLILSGVNLVPLDPTSIWIQNGAQRVDATSYFALSATGLQTFWTIPSDFPLGEYLVNLSFGAVTQGANIGKLVVVDEATVLKYTLNSINTAIIFRSGYTPVANTFYFVSDDSFRQNIYATNYPRIIDSTNDSAFKTDNVFLGNANSSWEIVIEVTKTVFSGNGGQIAPFLTLTETNNEQFISVDSIFQNYNILFAQAASITYMRNATGGTGVPLSMSTISPTVTIVIRKAGNVLTTYIFDPNIGTVTAFVSTIIDTSKNYALAMLNTRVTNGERSHDFKFYVSIYNQ